MVSAQYLADHNERNNAYVYYFNRHLPGRDDECYGSFHSSDLWYFFNSMRDEPGQRPWTDADHRMADVMSSYLGELHPQRRSERHALPEWPKVGVQPKFMRFADGYAYPVETTSYPARDAINRRQILQRFGLDELAVGN